MKNAKMLILVALMISTFSPTNVSADNIAESTIFPNIVDQWDYSDNVGDIHYPQAMEGNNTHLFVANQLSQYYAGRLDVYDAQSNLVDTFGENLLVNPIALYVNSTHVMVVDPYAKGIFVFDLAGNLVQQFLTDELNSNQIQLGMPMDIVRNGTHFWILQNNYISVFTSDLEDSGWIDVAADTALPDLDLKGMDRNATHIFIADSASNKILVYDLAGSYIDYFTTLMNHPTDLDVRTNKILLVGEYNAGPLVGTFDYKGNPLASYQPLQSYSATFAAGFVFVAEHFSITKFASGFTPLENFGPSSQGIYNPQSLHYNGTHFFMYDEAINSIRVLNEYGKIVDTFELDFIGGAETIRSNDTHLLIFTLDAIFVYDSQGEYTGRITKLDYVKTEEHHVFGNKILLVEDGDLKMYDSKGGFIKQLSTNFINGVDSNGTHIFALSHYYTTVEVFNHLGVLVDEFYLDELVQQANLNFIWIRASDFYLEDIVYQNGYMFIQDPIGNQIYVFSIDNRYITTIGGGGTGIYEMAGIDSIVKNGTHLLIVDASHTVKVIAMDIGVTAPTPYVTSDGIVLTWNPPKIDAGTVIEGYNIYRTENETEMVTQFTSPQTSFYDTDLVTGKTYLYSITADTDHGETNIKETLVVTYAPEYIIVNNTFVDYQNFTNTDFFTITELDPTEITSVVESPFHIPVLALLVVFAPILRLRNKWKTIS
ncbi:MAG: fibronectin type III domain-containing protein [Candidatus Kariarchaeaceae archaeon]|jgi:hypothetical protein